MGLAAIDIVFIGVIILFALHCCVKGFVSEVMSLAAAILGTLLGVFFFRKGALFIRDSFMPQVKVLPEIIAFVVIFLTTFIVIRILQVMLKNIIEGIRLGWLDRLLGFFFGFAEGIVIVCLLLFLIDIQPLVDSGDILNESLFAKFLLPFISGIRKEAADMVAPAFECIRGISSCV